MDIARRRRRKHTCVCVCVCVCVRERETEREFVVKCISRRKLIKNSSKRERERAQRSHRRFASTCAFPLRHLFLQRRPKAVIAAQRETEDRRGRRNDKNVREVLS